MTNAWLASTSNPNPKLGGLISVLINPIPKRRFFDPTFMCDCLLVDYIEPKCVCFFRLRIFFGWVENYSENFANTKMLRLSNPNMNSFQNSMHATCLAFWFSSKLGISGPICSNWQWHGNQPVQKRAAKTWSRLLNTIQDQFTQIHDQHTHFFTDSTPFVEDKTPLPSWKWRKTCFMIIAQTMKVQSLKQHHILEMP